MFSKTTFVAVLALLAAAPGALAAPAEVEKRVEVIENRAALTQATITVVNKHGKALSTNHVSNPGPTPISGAGSGTLAAGASAVMVVPKGWAGNIGLVEAGKSLSGDQSLIEGVLTADGKPGIDVSYVNGFSVPVVCRCNAGNTFQSGCSIDLWSKSKCPADDGVGSCKNARRNDNVKSALPFFAPCAGKAYTYPSDDLAMAYDKCSSGAYTCCVGTSC